MEGGTDGGLGMSGGDEEYATPKAVVESEAAKPEKVVLAADDAPIVPVGSFTDDMLTRVGAGLSWVTAGLWTLMPRGLRLFVEKIGIPPPLAAEGLDSLDVMACGCAIIGPTASGKTTIIAALKRACSIRRRGQLDLRFGIEPGYTNVVAELIKKAINTICDPKAEPGEVREGVIEATGKAATYGILVEGGRVLVGRENRVLFRLKFRFRDGPGGALFPQSTEKEKSVAPTGPEKEIRETLVKHIRDEASMLIICFDATTLGADYLSTCLPGLLSELSSYTSGGWPKLRAKRVLVLLNKVDLLCVRWREGIERRCYNIADRLAGGEVLTDLDGMARLVERFKARGLVDVVEGGIKLRSGAAADEIRVTLDRLMQGLPTAQWLAEHIDATSLAKEVMGTENLRSIYDHTRARAEVAVGICSASGFDPTGDSLLTQDGNPKKLPLSGTRDRFLERWRPFGLREAVEFLALGDEAPTVHVLDPEDFCDDNAPLQSLHAGLFDALVDHGED